MAFAYHVPTLYKARGLPLKRPVCAICVDRTRGRTECVQLGYRVSVWLCPAHADPAFQRRRGGRDFVRTLAGVWQANGCLTAARDRALRAHMERQRERPARPRPGSYAWPDLRRRLEEAYAGGAQPAHVAGGVRELEASCPARPPSRRTLQRWYSQRRWVSRPP
jgi:hypothetical protein